MVTDRSSLAQKAYGVGILFFTMIFYLLPKGQRLAALCVLGFYFVLVARDILRGRRLQVQMRELGKRPSLREARVLARQGWVVREGAVREE